MYRCSAGLPIAWRQVFERFQMNDAASRALFDAGPLIASGVRYREDATTTLLNGLDARGE